MDFFPLVNIAWAAGLSSCSRIAEKIDQLICKANYLILNPLIYFLGAVAFAYFLYGLVKFIANSENDEKREEGKNHMLYGIIGLAIIIAVFGIMRLIMNSLGVTGIDPEGGGVNL